jgi:hypothetical protein
MCSSGASACFKGVSPWRRLRTVLDVYGHLYQGADEAAAERLEELIVASRRDVDRDARTL